MSITKITEKEVLSKIVEAWSNGLDITPSSILNSEFKRYYVATFNHEYFESWQEAVETAGIPYEDVKKRNKELKVKKKAPQLDLQKKLFLEELVSAHNQGVNLKGGAIQKDKQNAPLYHRAHTLYKDKGRLFWETAVKEAHLPLDEIISKQKWTQEKVILTLQERWNAKKDLTTSKLESGFEKAIYRLFGTYENALVNANINPNKVIKHRRQTDEEILEEIRTIHAKGIDLNYTNLLHRKDKKYNALISKAFKRFKIAWGKVVTKAGIDYSPYDSIIRDWSKEKILQEIDKIKLNGEPLNIGYIRPTYPALASAAQTRYKSWKVAIEAYGLNYADVKQQNDRLSKDEILQLIKNAHKEGRDLSISAVIKLTNINKKDPLNIAYQASFTNFGNWRNAVKEAGLNYEEIMRVKKHTITSISNTIIEAAKKGHSLKPSKMTDPTLKNAYQATVARKIPWKKFVEKNNIKLNYKLKNSWKNPEQALHYLRQKYPTGVATAPSMDKDFFPAVHTHFENVEDAVNKAGLIYSRTGKIDGDILSDKRNTEILYKYNKGFLEKTADEVYYGTWDKVRKRIDKQDLQIEAFALFIESLHQKPPKADIRNYTKPIIVDGLKKFIKENSKEVLFTEEVFFDLSSLDRGRMHTDTEDEYISRIDNEEMFY